MRLDGTKANRDRQPIRNGQEPYTNCIRWKYLFLLGGFLGDCALSHHPDHLHSPVRPDSVNRYSYEGALVGDVNHWPPLFLEQLARVPR